MSKSSDEKRREAEGFIHPKPERIPASDLSIDEMAEALACGDKDKIIEYVESCHVWAGQIIVGEGGELVTPAQIDLSKPGINRAWGTGDRRRHVRFNSKPTELVKEAQKLGHWCSEFLEMTEEHSEPTWTMLELFGRIRYVEAVIPARGYERVALIGSRNRERGLRQSEENRGDAEAKKAKAQAAIASAKNENPNRAGEKEFIKKKAAAKLKAKPSDEKSISTRTLERWLKGK